MSAIRAVIFDFIGTLTSVEGYSLEVSTLKLHKAMVGAGFNVDEKSFLDAYSRAHEKYRAVRYEQLVEVTNAIWISETLNSLGFKTTPHDARVKEGVNIFFEDYVDSLQLRPCIEELLTAVSTEYKLGLISNFTYTPVIYAGLRKLNLSKFFNAILVSEAVGWRKPNPKIFQEALRRLGATGKEAVYVGDCPQEDIGGAQALGMRTVYVPSQFYSLEDLRESKVKPDLIVLDSCELRQKLPAFIKSVG